MLDRYVTRVADPAQQGAHRCMIYFARGADYAQIGLVDMKMHQLIRDGLEQNGVDFVVLEKCLGIQLDCQRRVVDFVGDRLDAARVMRKSVLFGPRGSKQNTVP